MHTAIKIAWVISIVVSILLSYLAAKYSIWKIADRASLAVYSLPFHLGIVLTLVLVYTSWFMRRRDKKTLDYFKKGFFLLFTGTYILLLVLFIWVFLLR